MEDEGGRPELRIFVIGAVRILGPDGEDLTPRGRKARALLAILALTPTRRRSRAALQDKLWSDRGPDQGAASLRQTLTEIRRAFGDHCRDCLVTDLRGIGLAPERVTVDIETTDLCELARAVEPPRLLDDIDIPDEEFEDWLRQQRTAFEQRLISLRPTAIDRKSELELALAFPARPPNAAGRPWLRVLAPLIVNTEGGLLFSRLVADRIAQGLVDQWAIDVRDDRQDLQGIQLRVEATSIGRDIVVNVGLRSADDTTQLWSGSTTIPLGYSFVSEAPPLQALINQTIVIAGSYLSRLGPSSDASRAFVMAFDATQRMFNIDLDNVNRADVLLRNAYELDSKAVYLAWRAYDRIFYVGEHIHTDRRLVVDEAKELARRALEADPHNATVLALTSYVYSFILHEFELAHELATASIACNPAHSLGHAFLGRAKAYLGDYDGGYRESLRSLELSGQGPYRFMLHALSGSAALLSGRFEEAARASEMACALAPTYRHSRRTLIPLYLKLGRREQARNAFEQLRRLEPTFSLDALRETSYPSAGIRASGLLSFRDRDL